MKTVGQIIDELDGRISVHTDNALHPDSAQFIRDQALQQRAALISLRAFITEEPKSNPDR